MYGSVYLRFGPAVFGIDPKKMEELRQVSDGTKLDLFRSIIAHCPTLTRLTPANNMNNHGYITPSEDGKFLLIRENLQLNPCFETLTIEDTYIRYQTSSVEIHCWVTVLPITGKEKLQCGIWNDDSHTIGVIVSNDPAKYDENRKLIRVNALNLRSDREALLQTLSGKKINKDLDHLVNIYAVRPCSYGVLICITLFYLLYSSSLFFIRSPAKQIN